MEKQMKKYELWIILKNGKQVYFGSYTLNMQSCVECTLNGESFRYTKKEFNPEAGARQSHGKKYQSLEHRPV